MTKTILMAIALSLMPIALVAQERNTGFMVHQLCVASPEGVATMNEMAVVSAPILTDLVEEGMISAWYDLRHGWGDEYNVGTVTVAESHRAWLDFWSEFVSRLRAEDAGAFGRANAACVMHKDNMYSVRNMVVGS